jgi:hypothetical protein
MSFARSVIKFLCDLVTLFLGKSFHALSPGQIPITKGVTHEANQGAKAKEQDGSESVFVVAALDRSLIL